MERTPESAVFAEFLSEEFSTPEEREAFERDVAQIVASANLITALDHIREAEGISKAEVARRIGTRRSVVSRLFSGRTANTNVATVAQVADALDCYLDVRIKPQPKRKRHDPIEIRTTAP